MLRKTLFAVALTGIAATASAGDSVRIYADSWGGFGIDYRWHDGGRDWRPRGWYAVPVDAYRGRGYAPRYYYAPPPRWYGAPRAWGPGAWSPWGGRPWGYAPAPYRPRTDWDRGGRGNDRGEGRWREHDRDGRGRDWDRNDRHRR